MGVPVLTLSGRSFASRVCGSLVRAAGLSDLVCTEPQDYVARAIALGNNRSEIEAYKRILETGRHTCRLFDTEMLVDRLEDLYRAMCSDHQKRLVPRPDLTNLDTYLEAGCDHDHENEEVLSIADYHGLYKAKLKRLHLARPMPADGRLWSAEDIALAEGDAPQKTTDLLPDAQMQIESTFTEIYKRNLWGSNESVSGPGSTLDYTTNLRSRLPELLEEFSIKSVFDAPCGDLNWMKYLLDDIDINYIGGDIVLPLIQSHRLKYKRANVDFIHIDLTKEKFPKSELMICRDCLFHLSFHDTLSVLQNFVDSNIKYLLTTTHKKSNRFENIDITTGGVRLIDLFSAPYHFPQEVLFRIEDWKAPYQEREMCLWSRDQVIGALEALAGWLDQRGGRPGGSEFALVPQTASSGDSIRLAGLRSLAHSLGVEGRAKDALLLLEHLAAVTPGDAETLRPLVKLLSAQGRTLEAIEKLSELKAATTDMESLLGEIEREIPPAIKCFNDHVAAGEVEQAERYASALAVLVPGNAALQNSALSCNIALGRKHEAAKYAAALLKLDATHAAARAVLAADCRTAPDMEGEVDQRVVRMLSDANNVHPLIRLRDIHDVASAILCGALSDHSVAQIDNLLKAARNLDVDVPEGSEWEGWAKHYRLAIEAIDVSAAFAHMPEPSTEPEIRFATSSGSPLDWSGVQTAAESLGAQAIFFAAADRTYVDLYAHWYINSILEHCDVPCLVILHVIGGAGNLRGVAKSLRIRSDRLIFAGDQFDAESVVTKCYDTPPKGLIARPIAHFQSVRFLRLGPLLEKLKRPVFVSDIDILLQRGIQDLLQRYANADVVLNENTLSANAGSRFTANLLLVNPTDNTALFLRFLQCYLERALSAREVTRWIDQFGLTLARHYLSSHGSNPRIDYFDTSSDINNVMYKSYQENPFRFLSLYHGFDMSSLNAKPMVQEKASAQANEFASSPRHDGATKAAAGAAANARNRWSLIRQPRRGSGGLRFKEVPRHNTPTTRIAREARNLRIRLHRLVALRVVRHPQTIACFVHIKPKRVMPAGAGIQKCAENKLGSRLRGNDTLRS